MLKQITPIILTFNEEANIARTLEKLSWAERILIIDSGSADGTLEIIARHGQARVVYRPFDDFASQCNFALSLVETSWVLSLDADYRLSDELVRELRELKPADTVSAYRAGFVYCVHGSPVRGGLYPPRAVLYRRKDAQYRNEGHGHRVVIDGAIADLKGKIFHDDRKPLARWFASQQRYAKLEADYLLNTQNGELRPADRVRTHAWLAPLLVFFYTLLIKACILDGWPGWHYTLQRTVAEFLIALEIVDRKLQKRQ